MATTSHLAYSAPFQRHLSFLDRDRDGFVYWGDSLRGYLSLGLDFPVAFIMSIGTQTLYGNTRPFFLGPLRGIEISRVTARRNMLEHVNASKCPAHGLNRRDLVAESRALGIMDLMHVIGLWALAANARGYVVPGDIEKYQQGTMLYTLEERRKDRSNVLPLSRGGPISVAGHSWFVGKLFGVKVYQADGSAEKDE